MQIDAAVLSPGALHTVSTISWHPEGLGIWGGVEIRPPIKSQSFAFHTVNTSEGTQSSADTQMRSDFVTLTPHIKSETMP